MKASSHAGRSAREASWAVAAIALTGLVFLCAVYLPDLGRGFIKDDFSWIEQSRDVFGHLRRLMWPILPGFYRPIVSLSFAIDFSLHGLSPRGYGFTNFALFLLCIAALVHLCRAAQLSWRTSALAAFVWALNPHAINMALLWISGRTALCLTLFAILATAAVLKRQHAWAAFCLAAALGSKEEAVLLPVIAWAWQYLLTDRDNPAHVRGRRAALAALSLPLAVYFALRAKTLALTMRSAPPFYQFTFAPAAVTRNILEYLDRGATASLVVLLLAFLVYRVRPVLRLRERRMLIACVIWFAGSYAITVFLPVRSSLYAVCPSVGSAIACAMLVERMRESASEYRPLVPLEAVLAMVLFFIPIQRSRDARWAEPARLSERALRTMAADLEPGGGGIVVLEDASDPLSSFAGAFGTSGAAALRLWTGDNFEVLIRPVADEGSRDLERTGQAPVAAVFRVSGGRVHRVPPVE